MLDLKDKSRLENNWRFREENLLLFHFFFNNLPQFYQLKIKYYSSVGLFEGCYVYGRTKPKDSDVLPGLFSGTSGGWFML